MSSRYILATFLLFSVSTFGQKPGDVVYCTSCSKDEKQHLQRDGRWDGVRTHCSWTECAIYRIEGVSAGAEAQTYRLRSLAVEFNDNLPHLVDVGTTRTIVIERQVELLTTDPAEFRKKLPPLWDDFFNRNAQAWEKIHDLRRLRVVKNSDKFNGTVRITFALDDQGRARDFRLQKALGRGLDEKAIEQAVEKRFPVKNGSPKQAALEVDFRLY
jgi:hypothetical protein